MAQFIEKSALVAEIERIKEYQSICDDYRFPVIENLKSILSFLDTLEVKEVDINKEISHFIDTNFEKATIGHKLSLRRVAKHFFELGIKSQKGEEA